MNPEYINMLKQLRHKRLHILCMLLLFKIHLPVSQGQGKENLIPSMGVYVLVPQPCMTLWPHGLQPARLLCPWNSLGKNTEVGCHSLFQEIFWHRDWTWVFCTAGRFFTIWATREALMCGTLNHISVFPGGSILNSVNRGCWRVCRLADEGSSWSSRWIKFSSFQPCGTSFITLFSDIVAECMCVCKVASAMSDSLWPYGL